MKEGREDGRKSRKIQRGQGGLKGREVRGNVGTMEVREEGRKDRRKCTHLFQWQHLVTSVSAQGKIPHRGRCV